MFQAYVGLEPLISGKRRRARLEYLKKQTCPEDSDDDDADPELLVTARVDELLNEFIENDEIIYILRVPSVSEYTLFGS